jgi:dolichol-phosphate mannosyltransferase
MKYLVVVPTFDEKENIQKLIPEILEQDEKIEILVVDDSSPDGTGEIVKKIGEKNKRVHLLSREKKEGLGAAYMAGLEWALKRGYDFMISMDADFSHQPKYLKTMVTEDRQIDLLVGSRYIPGGDIKGWNWKRLLNSRGANLFSRLALGLKTKDSTTGFRRYSKKFISSLNFKKFISSGYAFQVEMVMKAERGKFKVKEFPIVFIERQKGASKISGELIRSSTIVLRLAWQRKGLRQFAKFAVVGGVSTIIDWVAYFIISKFIAPLAIAPGQTLKQLSKAGSFIISAAVNFYFNRTWTFQSHDIHIATQTLKFYIVATTGLIFNNIIFFIVTKAIGWPDIWGLFFATGTVLFWNFFVNRTWTFRK